VTRATRSRIEQRLKRKGDIAPHRKGYADGWAAGRVQLAAALSSPEGFKAVDGSIFRMTHEPPPPKPAVEASRDEMQQFDTPGEEH
jgi:hypothetical protein